MRLQICVHTMMVINRLSERVLTSILPYTILQLRPRVNSVRVMLSLLT